MKIVMEFGEDDMEHARRAMQSASMHAAIVDFMSDLRYKYKHKELDEKEYALYDEVRSLACEYFSEYVDS